MLAQRAAGRTAGRSAEKRGVHCLAAGSGEQAPVGSGSSMGALGSNAPR